MLDYSDNECANTREFIMMKRAADAAPKTRIDTGSCPVAFDGTDAGFHLHVIASGSKGNAALVVTRGYAVLVDCGITKKAFFDACESLSFDPARIRAVIVTHEHSDHTKGLGVTLRGLKKLGCSPLLLTTEGTHEASSELGKLADTVEISHIRPGQDTNLGDMSLQFFSTSHDAADPIGIAFETYANGVRDTLGYATDTGYLTDGARSSLAGSRILALESNHDDHMLDIGPYPTVLKRRVASESGHLSNVQAAEAVEVLYSDRLEAVVGMHLSETNNTPHLVRATLEAAVARIGGSAEVHTAYQSVPVSVG